jgi:hypothetical protein
VTAFSVGVLRTDFTGGLGFKMTTGGASVVVTDLGRNCVAGNSATHTIRIVRESDHTTVATGSVNLSGCTGGTPVFVSITPVTLAASTVYWVISDELTSGDQWRDEGTITTTAVAASNGSAYETTTNNFSVSSAGSYSFTTPTFKYQ